MSDTQVHVDFWNDYYAEHEANPRALAWRVHCADVNGALIQKGLDAVGYQPGRLIEIGCGDGALARELVSRDLAKSWVGYEISETAAEFVRASQPERMEYVKAFNGETLPEPDDSFDVAVLSEVVEHAGRPVHLLSEAGRVAPLVAVQIVMTDTVAARRRANQVEEEEKLHRLNKFNRETALQALEDAGLRVLYQEIDHPPFEQRTFWNRGAGSLVKASLVEVVMRTAPPLSRRLFASTITTICTRTPA
jgi:SAM-dependent methyltransferase